MSIHNICLSGDIKYLSRYFSPSPHYLEIYSKKCSYPSLSVTSQMNMSCESLTCVLGARISMVIYKQQFSIYNLNLVAIHLPYVVEPEIQMMMTNMMKMIWAQLLKASLA